MPTDTQQLRKPLINSIKLAVLASGPCVYCGAPATSIDHDVPLARGGTDERDNLVPACWPCNSRKGTLTGDEFRAQYLLNPTQRELFARLTADIGDGREQLTAAGAQIGASMAERAAHLAKLNRLAGAIVWALRQQGWSWRAIYDATGIQQRNGSRWLAEFVKHGTEGGA